MKEKVLHKILRLKQLNGMIGSKGRFWLIIGITSSFLIGFVEYGIAGFIQILMVNIGLIEVEKLPKFLQKFAHKDITYTCLILVIIEMAMMYPIILSKPGIIPAINNAPISVDVIIP